MLEFSDDAVRGAALAYKAADRDLRRAVNQATVETARPLWRSRILAHKSRRQDRLVGTPNVTGGNPPKLTAYTGRKALSGGLDSSKWWAVEFGSAGEHGRRGQLPRRRNTGRIAYAALPGVLPRVVSSWVGIIYDRYGEVGE